MKSNSGFSLVELLVTLTVMAVITSYAVPSFSEAIRNNQLKSSASSLYSLFHFARAEAAQKGQVVHFGALDNANWSKGVVAWVDDDADSLFDPAKDSELRRSVNDFGLAVTEASGLKNIAINGKGYASAAVNLALCDKRDNETGRQLRVLVSGVAVITNKEDC